MWEKIREQWFGLAAVAVGGATVGMFVTIIVNGASYVFENIKWILYTETGLSVSFTIWAVERLIKDLRK